MKDLTDEFKLSVRSVPEVFEALGTMVHRLKAGRQIKFRDKKPTRAAVVNAALLYLASLPPEEWERALSTGLRRLEDVLTEGAAPAPAAAAEAPAARPAAPKRVRLKVEDVSPAPAPAKAAPRRKKGG